MKVFKINHKNPSLLNNLNAEQNGTVLFYHPQCSHCMSMKPEWEAMKKKMSKKKNCNIYEVNGENMETIEHPMKNVVDGFPTILNVNNGHIEPFEQERNRDNMIQFVLSNLNANHNINKNDATRRLQNKRVTFKLGNNNSLQKQENIEVDNQMKKFFHLYNNNKTVKKRKRKRKQKRKDSDKKKGNTESKTGTQKKRKRKGKGKKK